MLKDTIGLSVPAIGTSAVRNAVSRRMAACGLPDVEAYTRYLLSTNSEFEQLIEIVVVPETWFFRDAKPFALLQEIAREKVRAASHTDAVRILSLPCSTGEEPYSIAITLLQAGLRAQQFSVDAADISRRCLDIASRASYGNNSFRGQQDPALIERYFATHNGRYLVTDPVRSRVRFRQENILDYPLAAATGVYDVIFCRNLFIYLDDPAKERAYETLNRLLKHDGTLVVGHAECGTVPPELFHSTLHADTFAFHKAALPAETRQDTPAARNRRTSKSWRQKTPAANPKPAQAAPRPFRNVHPAAPPTSDVPDDDELEQARRLADMGHLEQASEICRSLLDVKGKRARAHFLLGVIEDARGRTDHAERHLRKAIYLDPKHYEALVHLALLVARKGDRSGAELLRCRAQRARDRQNA